MISTRSFFTRILAALAVLISVCYGGARLATAQYSPAGGNTFGGLTGVLAQAPLEAGTVAAGVVPIGIVPATDSVPGSMSAADKTKLDGITAGSNTVNGITALTGSCVASGAGADTCTVTAGDGTGTGQYGSGTTFTQNANQVTWKFADGGGAVSYGYGVDVTSASTFTNCGVLAPSATAATSNAAGLVTCQFLCQDVTAFLDGGGVTNGHASSGSVTAQWNQAGADAGGLTVNAGTFVPLFTNTLAISGQVVLDAGSVYTQVEYTTGSVYAHCVCECGGPFVGPN